LNRIARSALYYSGLLGAVRRSRRQALRILVYHRFDDFGDRGPELEWQCEHIRRYYSPLPLREVTENSKRGEGLPPNPIAVTVDDGHRDFLKNALPVFLAYEIPVTLFVVSDAADKKIWLWFDQISYLVGQTNLTKVDMDGETIELRSDRRRAANRISETMKRMPNRTRLARLAELAVALAVEIPAQPSPQFALLDWNELRWLAKQGVGIGCHSKTHPILSRIETRAELEDEIGGAKMKMERELGTRVLHFAYPNGTWHDFNEEITSMVRASGFRCALSAESGLNEVGVDPFALSRLGVEPSLSRKRFAELLAGVRKY
jgi:peptidoglycan/xylan/chitin deacetylase (PgdA/CDA1 family)